jgi:hypothetical protein
MFDHQGNDLVVCELTFAEAELTIDRFAGAKKFPRGDLHLTNQLGEFRLGERFNVIVHFIEISAALPEQFVQFTTLRSGWFFVNSDFHNSNNMIKPAQNITPFLWFDN